LVCLWEVELFYFPDFLHIGFPQKVRIQASIWVADSSLSFHKDNSATLRVWQSNTIHCAAVGPPICWGVYTWSSRKVTRSIPWMARVTVVAVPPIVVIHATRPTVVSRWRDLESNRIGLFG
jgi:hypothetical protein